jgi:hypothetical protein
MFEAVIGFPKQPRPRVTVAGERVEVLADIAGNELAQMRISKQA